ncbi:MAG: cytochrome-c peroxidase [Chitinophagales bacterium]
MKKSLFIWFSLLLLLFCGIFPSACQQKIEKPKPLPFELYPLSIPKGFPKPNIAADNPLTKVSVALGKKLFFDPILSSDSSIACASCHHSHKAFSDTVRFSRGVEGRLGKRNAPPLMNLAYNTTFLRDGGARTLPLQVLIPLTDHAEMNLRPKEAVKRLKNQPEYVEMTRKAYNKEINLFTITRALAAFQKTLISSNSAYDKYHFEDQKDALSPSQMRGLELFQSAKTSCTKCHSDFNFTSNTYENNGLYAHYQDEGRFLITRDSIDMAKFKVPTLRNIALTAPYMHDGSLNTLEEVIQHYESGGKPHVSKNPHIRPFELTEQEREDLKVFLESLTDVSTTLK